MSETEIRRRIRMAARGAGWGVGVTEYGDVGVVIYGRTGQSRLCQKKKKKSENGKKYCKTNLHNYS